MECGESTTGADRSNKIGFDFQAGLVELKTGGHKQAFRQSID
jgi:hypothetical protein